MIPFAATGLYLDGSFDPAVLATVRAKAGAEQVRMPTGSHPFPQRPDRNRPQTFAEADAGLAVAEHDALHKRLPRALPEPAQTAEIGRRHRRRGLYLDPGNLARAALQHNIDLVAVLVAEVVESDIVVAPTGMPAQLPEDKRLERLAQHGPVLEQRFGIAPEQRAGDARVPDVELWSLDQAAD